MRRYSLKKLFPFFLCAIFPFDCSDDKILRPQLGILLQLLNKNQHGFFHEVSEFDAPRQSEDALPELFADGCGIFRHICSLKVFLMSTITGTIRRLRYLYEKRMH